jgi:hypothetical protein
LTLFLVDTSVISEIAPERQGGSRQARQWFDVHQDETRLSALTVMEIAQGVARLRRKHPGRRAEAYAAWLDRLEDAYDGKILAFDNEIARRAGSLSDVAFSTGRHPGLVDIGIAATADIHGLTVLTRNLKHFVPLEVPCLDPFEAL